MNLRMNQSTNTAVKRTYALQILSYKIWILRHSAECTTTKERHHRIISGNTEKKKQKNRLANSRKTETICTQIITTSCSRNVLKVFGR